MVNVIERKGDLFRSGELAIGHGINTQGVMGAGVALGFARRWPEMFNEYRRHCLAGNLQPGNVWIYHAPDRIIFNICSQDEPGPRAKIEWIRKGIFDAIGFADFYDINRLAIPRIGCGIGGLRWEDVREAIVDCGWAGYDFTIVVYH